MEYMIFATWTLFAEPVPCLHMTTGEELGLLFKDFNEDYMNLLQPLFEKVNFRAGEKMIVQGRPAQFLYLVVNGTAEISYKPYDGESITVSHVTNGGLFGWSALVGSPTYTSSATAIEDVAAVRISGTDLRNLCADNPEAGRVILDKLASAVSNRWKDAHAQVRKILEDGMNS